MLLTVGLLLFLGAHALPVFAPLRRALAARLGENRYKAVFSLVSALGLVLIVVGYAQAPRGEQLFAPSIGARHLLPPVMIVAFILLAAANMKGHLRAKLRHPMLMATLLWSALHLAATGHERAALLFGAFLVWAALDLVSASARGAVKPFTPRAKHDLIAVAGGTVAALGFMALHRWLIGVPAVPWSL